MKDNFLLGRIYRTRSERQIQSAEFIFTIVQNYEKLPVDHAWPYTDAPWEGGLYLESKTQ